VRGSIRLLVLVALAVGALAAATAAPAAKGDFQARELGRAAHGKAAARLPATVKRALRAQTSVRSAGALLGSAVQAEQLGPGEFPGFAYCGDDVAYIWPADAPGQDATITRTYIIYSESGNFTDAVVDPSPFYVVQVGPDFYIYDIEAAEVVYGPTNYPDAWLELDLTGNTDHVVFVNEVTTLDAGSAATEYVLIETLGPSETGTPNVCQP
jgi:hypothetical protein